jgi:hypothetical protein
VPTVHPDTRWFLSVSSSSIIDFLLNIILRVIKSRRMRWAGHVAPAGERRSEYRILIWIHERERTLEAPRRRGRIVLK